MISYSQNFEDVILNRIFKHKRNGFYIDVGAHDPNELSVTKHFYEKGWNGINIEPIPRSYQRLKEARPRDINLNVAIGQAETHMSFYVVVDQNHDKTDVSAFSSSNLEEVQETCRKHTDEFGRELQYEEISVKTQPLADICDQFCPDFIDFLKIDVEGAEAEVLKSCDFERYRPTVVLLEAKKTYTNPITDQVEVYQDWDSFDPIIQDAGYEFVYFDGLNRYYLRKESLSLKHRFDVPLCMYDRFITEAHGKAIENGNQWEKRANELTTKVTEQTHHFNAEIEKADKELQRLQADIQALRNEKRALEKEKEADIQALRNEKKALGKEKEAALAANLQLTQNLTRQKEQNAKLTRKNQKEREAHGKAATRLVNHCAAVARCAEEQFDRHFQLAMGMHAWQNAFDTCPIPNLLLPKIPTPAIPDSPAILKEPLPVIPSSDDSVSAQTPPAEKTAPAVVYPYGSLRRYPDLTGKRKAEGGSRLSGKVRNSQAGKPLVTVVTTVYNGVKHLEQAMRSIFNQSYENIEYIVIDAASTDGTLDVIKACEDRVDYFISEPDEGIYSGMNKGLSLASGEFAIVLNADDYYTEDAIAKLVNKALAEKADITAAHSKNIDPSGNRVEGKPGGLSRSTWTPFAYIACPLKHETMLVKRHVYEEVGLYDESIRICADWVWMATAYDTMKLNVSIVDEELLFFRKIGVSQSAALAERHAEERLQIYPRFFPGINEQDLQKLKWVGGIKDQFVEELIRNNPDCDNLHAALKAKDSWKYATRCDIAN
nr:FkbM family methyltransferase [uncultured Pseudodesulfovibrio sp.]